MRKIAYEMTYEGPIREISTIACIPFSKKYFDEFVLVYNACFYDMRKALDRKPYNVLHTYEQISNKIDDLYLLIENNHFIGAVSCCNNEVDDLIVHKDYQKQGYGRQLLLFGMQMIRNKSDEPIILHVAQWNAHAIRMYKQVGFEISKIEEII